MEKQRDTVLRIVKRLSPVRTEVIKILAMRRGVSCADRYLRWLQDDGEVTGYTKSGDRTKTWYYIGRRMGGQQ